MERVADSAVAPDGRQLAYTLRTTDMAANRGRTGIWLLDLHTPGASAVRISDLAANAGSAQWSADGHSIFYLSNRSGSDQI